MARAKLLVELGRPVRAELRLRWKPPAARHGRAVAVTLGAMSTSVGSHSPVLPFAAALLSGVMACTTVKAPAPEGLAQRKAASEPGREPLPEQTSYCTRLQPLLDQAVRSAQIGTEMTCLDMPGVTELGRYGSASAAEEDALLNCFSETAKYQSLLEAPESSFQLSIDDAFLADAERSGRLGLGALIPWLPEVSVAAGTGTRLSAEVVIRDARFVTLVGVASKLQGEPREEQCLRALCNPDYTYVHKALVGMPSVALRAEDSRRQAIDLRMGPLGAGFADQELASGGMEIASKHPVTLAVARSSFRTAQTERLCQFCGKRDQACCGASPSCDGGLGCVDDRCRPLGGPGEPCDAGRCSAGAVCVAGTCRVECGGLGQPCCSTRECAGTLRCAAPPNSTHERLVLSQQVTVEGGFFGTDEDRALGLSNCGGLERRSRFAVTKRGGGRGECARAWWFDPDNDRDCRVGVHFNVSSLGQVDCQLDVYATPPARPDVCGR